MTSRQCAHCLKPLPASQPATAMFCTRKCKTDAANFEAARGKLLYRLAYNWRRGKGPAFSDLSWLVDQFIKEDRESGRPAPPPGPTDMTVAQSYHTRQRASAGGRARSVLRIETGKE